MQMRKMRKQPLQSFSKLLLQFYLKCHHWYHANSLVKLRFSDGCRRRSVNYGVKTFFKESSYFTNSTALQIYWSQKKWKVVNKSHSWAKFKILLVRKLGRKFYYFMAKFQGSGFSFPLRSLHSKVAVWRKSWFEFPAFFLISSVEEVL